VAIVCMTSWRVEIIGGTGRRIEQFGSVEAPDQLEAYRLAIEKFDIPIERQGRLFVVKVGAAKD
jgi:hypothetical protein